MPSPRAHDPNAKGKKRKPPRKTSELLTVPVGSMLSQSGHHGHVNSGMKRHQLAFSFEDADLDVEAFHLQGDEGMYEDNVVARRGELRHHPDIVGVMSAFWHTHLHGQSSPSLRRHVTEEEYTQFYLCAYKLLHREFDESSARGAAKSDWEADRKDQKVLNRELYFDALFELADHW